MNRKRTTKNAGTLAAGLYWNRKSDGFTLRWIAKTEDEQTCEIVKKNDHVYAWTITNKEGEASTGQTVNEAFWHAADDIAKRLKEIAAASA